METKMIIFDGVPIVAPVVNGNIIEFPYNKFKNFTSYCGAGKGVGDFVVPETVLQLKVSLACYIHDRMWELANPTWLEFHASNSVFRSNIDSIIQFRSQNTVMEHLRYYRSVTYFNAVNTLGAYYFWKLKREDGYTGDLDKDVTLPAIANGILEKLGVLHSWVKTA